MTVGHGQGFAVERSRGMRAGEHRGCAADDAVLAFLLGSK
jgi:hypothetical protein